MPITGSQALIHSLLAEGVDTIFGYPGGAILPVYDALYDFRDRIHHVLTRHEQGATHAAEGYAQASGKPGVCLATSGPGATNLITGITNAMMDSSPLVCITGQVHSHFLGTDAFQEADILSLSAPVTKWSTQIRSARDISSRLAKAFYLATEGRPGPILIDITKDAQEELIEYQYKKHEKSSQKTKIDMGALKDAALLINTSLRPLLLIGHGIPLAHAETTLHMLAEKAHIPVASTLLGISTFPTKHPLYMGMVGMYGNYGPNILTNQADVIIAIGMRFDDRVTSNLNTYAKQAKIIHIDIDQAELGKLVTPTIAIHANAQEAIEALLPLIQENKHTEWIKKFYTCKAIEYEKVIKNEIHPKSEKLKMAEVIHHLSTKDQGSALIVTDVGQHQMSAALYHIFEKSHSFITSGGLGTMGFALPAAIGAKLAVPERDVIAIIGDGGFQMTVQELGVIAQEKIPIKIIILNNEYLGMVRQWQDMFFKERYSFTEMHNPNFIKLADAYGISAYKITTRSDLDKGIESMLNAKEAFILEVAVEQQHNIFPMVVPGDSISNVRLE